MSSSKFRPYYFDLNVSSISHIVPYTDEVLQCQSDTYAINDNRGVC